MSPHPPTRLWIWQVARTARVILLICTLPTLGCDLPGLPQDPTPPPPTIDLGILRPDLDLPPMRVCTPDEITCYGEDLRECNADGTDYTVRPCSATSSCLQGRCVESVERCQEGELPIAISRTTLFFEPSPDGKAVSASLQLTNCSANPVTIRKAVVDSPIDYKESPVFALSLENASLANLTLEPGRSLPIKIDYRPRDPLGLEQGRLYLTFDNVSDIPITREVALKTSSWCLGLSPLLELGALEVGENFQHSVSLHNCGTRSLLLSAAQLVTSRPREELGDHWELSGAESPVSIAPGEAHTLRLDLTPGAPGALLSALNLLFAPNDQRKLGSDAPLVPITALAIPPLAQPCEDDAAYELIGLDEGEVTLRPLNAYPIALLPRDDAPEAPLDAALFNARSFDTETPPFLLTSGDTLFGPTSTFFPYTSGTYEISSTRYVFQDESATCARATRRVQIAAQSDYQIELSWYSPDDPVPDDLGPGHGVDLDLLLDFFEPQDDVSRLGWDSEQDGCLTSQSATRCANGRAFVFHRDASGRIPEVIGLSQSEQTGKVELGVYVRNMASYQSACATLRIWRGEQLVAQHPPVELASPECNSIGHRLSETDSFWIVGVLDTDEADPALAFDVSPERTIARGLPSP